MAAADPDDRPGKPRVHPCGVDWSAIASVLGERTDRPVLLVDENFVIRLSNRRMEQALGWRRFELIGRSLLELCIPTELRDEARSWIQAGLRGAIRVYDTLLLTKAGSRLQLQFHLDVVGRSPTPGLLLTVESMLASVEVEQLDSWDLSYEVELDVSFGDLVRIITSQGTVDIGDPETKCYALIHELAEPCLDCPLRTPGARRSVIRSRDGAFEVTSIERQSATAARLSRRLFEPDLLSQIQEHKLRGLATKAGLTSREAEVLDCLLLGRTIDDIAAMLSISTRTVKYHQTNLLEKLGADSRIDLFRLIL